METKPKIGLIILAAGGSSRMGSPKQLLPFHGMPLIRFATETALATECRPVIVVLGSRAPEITPQLASLEIIVVRNQDWELGIGSSIRAGVAVAEEQNCDGVILTLADQPFVSSEILTLLIKAHLTSTKPIVASRYGGSIGVPAYFSRRFFPRLLTLAPSHGCKGLLLSCSDEVLLISCPEAERDIDTPEDYNGLVRGEA